jgi:ubiquinone/menaquinone biosynthesis C-methylase UbiE
MIARALRKFGDPPPPNLDWTAADACAPLPFEPASFDIVLLVAVLGELPDPDLALSGFHRLLASGGTLAVHEHLPDPDWSPPSALRALAEKAGFRPVSLTGRRWNYTALFER